SAINLDPTWSDTLTNLTYTIYHHSTPYFTPNAGTILAEKSVLGHTDGNIVNNESNYFYLVHEAHCNPNSSQQIGIFKFPIIAAD
ncbi:MAG: hypothetical protein KDE48_13970, partial [Anaerolineales bacterium]|nr:hypothetical protein [Anaerolineales bacterium]